MIVYLDTSALVPLLIAEPSSPACGELWDAADSITSTRLAYIEAVAAMAMAQRMGRISTTEVRDGSAVLEELWQSVDVIELDRTLMAEAARLAVRHSLRGYDATHCAAAIEVNDVELVATSGDQRLIAAWRAEGLAVRNLHA